MLNGQKRNAVIKGVGGYVPEDILGNRQLEEMVATTDEWIISRTGIRERRILKDPKLATSDMAAWAIKDALAHAAISPRDIDCLLLATSTPDVLLAPSAAQVCEKAGLTKAWGVDMNAACSGFVYALSMGASLIESGRCDRVVVVGADKMSSIVNYEDRNTCILFGDGAGAVILEATTEPTGIIDSYLKTDGSGTESLYVPAGGSLYPASQQTVSDKKHFIQQDGRTVFRHAVNSMSEACKKLMERNSLSAADISWIIPHQANLRIIQAVSEEAGIGLEKFKINIQKYGNTTAATVPLCLWDFKNDFSHGDNILLASFGAGYSWGGVYLKWGI